MNDTQAAEQVVPERVSMLLRVWGTTAARIEYAIRHAGQRPSRNAWDFATIERLTGPTCLINVRNPDRDALAAEQGFGWAYAVYRIGAAPTPPQAHG